MTDYKKQYLKYKNKYLKIKKMLGGSKSQYVPRMSPEEREQEKENCKAIILAKTPDEAVQLLREAEKLKETARKEADKLKRKAKEEADALVKDAQVSAAPENSYDSKRSLFGVAETLEISDTEKDEREEREKFQNTVSIIAVIGGIVGLVFLIK